MKIPTERLVVGGVALLVGLLLGWMVRGVATYNTKGAVVTPIDDWRIACPAADAKQAACELSTDVVDPNQGALARVTIATDKDGKELVGFTVPLGVALEAGLGLAINKDPVKVYQYRTCTSTGCLSTTPFDDKMIAAFKGASDGRVMFATLEGKPVAVPMSFKGYAKAYATWRSAEAKRHSWFWRLWS